MSEKWYPVIDYSKCAECGICVENCPHNVFDKAKFPSPVVINPEACISGCHNCGNNCPKEAIQYVGDNSGWCPSKGAADTPVEPCNCQGAVNSKQIQIKYLYLDKKTCERCMETDKVLENIISVLTPALELAGYSVALQKIEVKTEEMARQYRFLSSPTIRINGIDVFQSVEENSCGCCSDISGTDVDCRAYSYNDEIYETPPTEMLAHAILDCIFNQSQAPCSCEDYTLPENLKTFFEGKKTRLSCSCGEMPLEKI